MQNFFFKSVQNYMKDAECAETKEKSNFGLLFLSYSNICTQNNPQFSMNFHDNLKKNRKNTFFIRFSTLLIFH